jgi:type II secretory pathway pseudopilin PulG
MVIAIIGLIAAMVLGVMPGVMHRKVMARVQIELTQLQGAIEYYKEKHGFYPPDNQSSPPNIAEPPLFYELIGTTNVANLYYPANGEANVASNQIKAAFGLEGFVNSDGAGEVKNFYPKLKASQFNYSPFTAVPVRVLTVPAEGPKYPANPGTARTNTWRYIVARPDRATTDPYPTNNPNTYDLWAEVVYGGRTHVIGNWRR